MRAIYPVSNIISIWVGQFASESEFDYCVDHTIVKLLKLDVEIASICEVSFETTEVPIRKLLEGFSGWEGFVEQAESEASIKGIAKANSALVCNYLKCEDAPNLWGTMTFLGSFTGRDVT